jgi:hypothetical protein
VEGEGEGKEGVGNRNEEARKDAGGDADEIDEIGGDLRGWRGGSACCRCRCRWRGAGGVVGGWPRWRKRVPWVLAIARPSSTGETESAGLRARTSVFAVYLAAFGVKGTISAESGSVWQSRVISTKLKIPESY